ncbi:hypothetical protein lerEdw1_018806 [Lerista edwardsae]|nr:hypothetical protein lerEdw1_018806 [Lerista edwardsae]
MFLTGVSSEWGSGKGYRAAVAAAGMRLELPGLGYSGAVGKKAAFLLAALPCGQCRFFEDCISQVVARRRCRNALGGGVSERVGLGTLLLICKNILSLLQQRGVISTYEQYELRNHGRRYILVRMLSEAGTGYSFNIRRLRLQEKLTMLRFDPFVKQRVLFKEQKKIRSLG